MLLEGKVAIVSGIGPGMGRDIALALARHGADLALGARRPDFLESVATEIETLGRRVVWRSTDIADRAACDALVAACVAELGGVDILVNNAFTTGPMQSFESSNLDEWHQAMDVNLWGSLHLTQAALEPLKAAGSGRVIMINTTSSQLVEANYGAYSASKGALKTVTQTLARELGGYGIRVNGIHPGYIWGPSVEWYFQHLASERGVDPQVVHDEVAATSALGYIPDSEELAGTVVYLASSLSNPVTGQSINVSCGTWMQ